MFAQKPPSLFTKMGDAYAILLISALFMVGGLLLSHQTPLAAVFILLMLPLPALLYVSTRVKPTACESQPSEADMPALNDTNSIEWKQIVGKDGETVEVGYVKKQINSAKQKIAQRPSLTNSG